ncbi:MAG: sulfate permease [Anaerolineae bacterium]|nr:sulfate permease [Anaerolineae bacterium]
MLSGLTHIPHYFLQPVRLFHTYRRLKLRPDLVAGLTVAVIAIPQAIAFALIAELPPQMGLYATIVGAIVGALWGSSNQLSTGPANAISLLVFSSLMMVAFPGSPEFIIAAGVMAVLVGLIQLVIGLARLGALVNFVSHSVIVGFSAGAGILISLGQLPHLLGLEIPGRNLIGLVSGFGAHFTEIHWPTSVMGLGAIGIILLLRKINPKLPTPLISIVLASGIVFLGQLNEKGVDVIGQLPSGFPPFVRLPIFNFNLITSLSTGALAIAAIGLIQSTAIVRSLALQTGQRTDNNQEFVGQGLANMACGFFSGYPGAGSFARSVVNFEAGAQTRFSGIFAGIFLLVATFSLGSLTAYLPRAALAGVLMVTAYGLIDWAEIRRIWRGTRADALIMLVTLFGTLFLRIEFAVLLGILFSFAVYIVNTSMPRVFPVVSDESYEHFVEQQPHQVPCPQLGILTISGDLYFGAVRHVEETIYQHLVDHPTQRFLLLRMHAVNQCDFRGVQMLEAIAHRCQERGGALFLMRVQRHILAFMKTNGFYDRLGSDHFLDEDAAIRYLFTKVIDSSICIYECMVRAFKECQNLPKQTYLTDEPLESYLPRQPVPGISPQELAQELRNGRMPLVIDVREPREFKRGHIPQAKLIPLPHLLANIPELPADREVVLVCQGGWRSQRAMSILFSRGYQNVKVLEGGMLAWETAGLAEIDSLGE